MTVDAHDFTAYVVVGAPNHFPVEDYLRADEQMTLDRAFAELREGMRMVPPRPHEPNFHKMLSADLDVARGS
ncbi:hypothetical protein [Dokdonella sp.]|uniref:hypothetical protein n=1 Tax=Dokdonella sp. TaxID=2291710 RepID=UPI003784F340